MTTLSYLPARAVANSPIFPSLPVPHVPPPAVLSHEHDPHLVLPIRVRQVDLLRAAAWLEPGFLGGAEVVLRPRKGLWSWSWSSRDRSTSDSDHRKIRKECLDRRLGKGRETEPDQEDRKT